MSDDSSCLEQELERLLLLEDESLLAVSTPRQRLEDARAMADGVVLDCDGSLDCDDGSLGEHLSEDEEEEERVANDDVDGVCRDAETKEDDQEETSTHLLQRLSRDMADSGEWRRFHDINHESQGALAEMNVALGSLQQWRKQRRVESTHCGLRHPPTAALEPLPVPQPSAQPQTAETNASPEEGFSKARDVDNPVSSSAEEEDPLLTLWQGHHLRAQEAAERLQKQLSNFVPRSRDDKLSAVSTENDLPETTMTSTTTTKKTKKTHKTTVHDLAQENKVHTFAPKKTAFQGLIAQEKRRVSSPSEEVVVVNNTNNNNSSGNGNSDENRVLNLRREVESLEMNQLIENARVQASGQAVEFAREACDDDLWRGTQRSVGEMEGELAGFTEDLDSLLLRLGSGFDGREGIAGEGEEDDVALGSGDDDERAPAADMHIDR